MKKRVPVDNTRAVLDKLFPKKNERDRKYLSYSFLSGMKECPALQLNDSFQDNLYTVFGNIVHRIIERLITFNSDPNKPNMDPDIVRNIGYNMIDDPHQSTYFKGKQTEMKQKIDSIVSNYSSIVKEWDGFSIIDVEGQHIPENFKLTMFNKNYFCVDLPDDFFSKEERKELKLKKDQPVPLIGNIDVTYMSEDGTKVIIRDWKTGKTKIPDSLQVSIYAYAIFTMYPQVDKINSYLEYVEHNDDKLVVFVREDSQKDQYAHIMYKGDFVDVMSYNDVLSLIKEYYSFYYEGHSDPIGSPFKCKWCDHRESCPSSKA